MHSFILQKRCSRPRWSALAAACLAATTLSLSLPARAGDDALLPRAVELIERRDPAAGYELLRPEEPRLAGTPDFDYLLGISALDAGHVTRAIFALERVVLTQPDNALARAELARAYLAAGEADHARDELTRARRAELPRAAAVAIDRVLGALDREMPSPQLKWSAFGEAGAGRDSNVNSANTAGEFAIPAFGGAPSPVDPQNRRQSDNFAFAAAGGNAQLPLSVDWKVVAGANGRVTKNSRVHAMDLSTVDGTLGLSHTRGAHSQTVAIQSNTVWLASSTYRTANGLSAQWQSQLDSASQGSAFVQWARQEYAGRAERNTDRTVLGLAYARVFERTRTLGYASLYGAEEAVRNDGYAHFGHRAFGWRVGAEQAVDAATTLFAEVQREQRRYGSTEPFFDTQRIDRQSDLLVGLRWTVAPGWTVVPSLRHTAARSNVPLYDYGRTVGQIALRKEFP